VLGVQSWSNEQQKLAAKNERGGIKKMQQGFFPFSFKQFARERVYAWHFPASCIYANICTFLQHIL
jgi:hypothetical protein